MKKQTTRALLGLAAALMLTVAVNAQVRNSVTVRVPFDFVAGETQMPAGRYTVQRIKIDSESTLLIRSEDGRSTAIVLTNTGEKSPRTGALTFRQHGDRYFLAEVSMPGTASVRALPKAGTERRLERELAEQKGGESKTVTVVGSVQ